MVFDFIALHPPVERPFTLRFATDTTGTLGPAAGRAVADAGFSPIFNRIWCSETTTLLTLRKVPTSGMEMLSYVLRHNCSDCGND
jgi:hypothetical protein